MIDQQDSLYKDFEAVRQIPVINSMLEVVCRLTGMGFAAVARVTEDRWLACRVRDEISFGLEEGGELKIETTICNEIRDTKLPVIIDHVSNDQQYADHHTPKMYGFQSYISYPILLKSGDFFGTLCAIDPNPADLHNPKIMGTFSMFAELLSFHLQSIDLINRSEKTLYETNRQLNFSRDEIGQYQKISHHNLREPLRKIRFFSDMLMHTNETADAQEIKRISGKINSFAEELSKMIQDVSDFTALNESPDLFEPIDLNLLLPSVKVQLRPELMQTGTDLDIGALPVIKGIPVQIAQLFFHLTKTAVLLTKPGNPSVMRIYTAATNHDRVTIVIENSDTNIQRQQLENIFDVFIHTGEHGAAGYGNGLANCRKIVHQHGGELTAYPNATGGASFSVVLPA